MARSLLGFVVVVLVALPALAGEEKAASAVEARKPPELPKESPPLTPDGTTLTLDPGEYLYVTPPCEVTRVAVSATNWDVRFPGKGLLLFQAFGPGRSTFLGWCGRERQVTYPIEVREIAHAAPKRPKP